ncbi:MAG: hypothetical protein A2068_08765 [Ignavibacteria bacterium GWB2_35_6b]|nr:MAG: hypothetical protein A2068_08765 [Ignavibacteria bacterium GWB2_35_6b]
MIKRLTLLEAVEGRTARDGNEYHYRFSLVDTSLVGMPEENYYTSMHRIKVFISGTMEAVWLARQANINFLKVCYEYAKNELIQKVKDGSIQNRHELEIMSTNYPNQCPFQSDRIVMEVGAAIDFEVSERVMEDISIVQLASSIIDLRDFINAILKERHGKKLIKYAEERDLLQMFRSANNIEDFVYRVSALKLFATNLNEDLLRELTGDQDRNHKSITLLETYLQTFANYDEIVIATLKNINRIRQMYPIHGDNIDGVQDAHTYFQIEYPIRNPSDAWKKILNSYRDALSRIFEIIK